MIHNTGSRRIITILVVLFFMFIELTGAVGTANNGFNHAANPMVYQTDSSSGKIYVNFVEKGLGLGLGRTWSVDISGINYTTTNRTITFVGNAGSTYSYSVNQIPCSTMTNSSSSFSSNRTYFIHFSLKSSFIPLGVPSKIIYYVPVAVYNSNDSSTSTNFTDFVTINSSIYRNYENRNLTNVEFFDSSGNIIPSWLQTGNSYSSNSTIYWLMLNKSIPGKSSYVIYMGFSKTSVQLMNGVWVGEAPELTNSYGAFDNGYHVFHYYYNFSGNSINYGRWILNNSAGITQNNGISGSFLPSGGYLASKNSVGPGFMVNEFITQVGDGQDDGFINVSENPIYMGYNVTQGDVIRDASIKTYPDAISLNPAEYNPSGTAYGNFTHSEKTTGIFTVETLNKSSTFQFLNYNVGNTSQPLTGLNENFPMNFGLDGRGCSFALQWISVSRTPPNYKMPYDFAYSGVENQSRTAVNIEEVGLPLKTTWGISVNGTVFQANSAVIPLILANGVYSFYVVNDPSYSIIYNFNDIVVNGINETLYVQFVPEYYTLVFDETGLNGQNWNISFSNGEGVYSANFSSIVIPASNFKGLNLSFSFDTTVAGEIPILNETPRLSGSDYILDVAFQKPYNVTFIEHGLPSGYRWYVNMTNGVTLSAISGSSISIFLVNATYYYNIGTALKNFHSPGGNFTVKGKSINISVVFSDFNYSVVFHEVNLSSGSWWYVNITGNATKSNMSGDNIYFDLINGTYNYSLFASNTSFIGYGGTFTVNGTGLTIGVVFHELFPITFIAKNLSAGSQWTVSINGTEISSKGNSIPFNLDNGSYSFNVFTANKNQSTNYTQYFTVQGKPKTVYVIFSRAYTVNFTESNLGNGLWYVNLSTGISENGTIGSRIAFHLINGQYNFTVQTSNKTFRATYIPDFSVYQQNRTINILFVQVLYKVFFNETGLQDGYWFVNLTAGNRSSAISVNGSYSINIVNGTYAYSVQTTNKTFRPEYSGFLIVNGSQLNITITFVKVQYFVNYYLIYPGSNPNGKPITWEINVTSYSGGTGLFMKSSTKSVRFGLSNGTYFYTIHNFVNIYRMSNLSGSFTISGKNISLFSTLTIQYYDLVIHETGLNNIPWYVNITSMGNNSGYVPIDLSRSSTGSNITLEVCNGTYSLHFGDSGSGYIAPSNIPIFDISGKNYSIAVKFTRPLTIPPMIPPTFGSLIANENFILPLLLIAFISAILVGVARTRFPEEP